MYRYGGGKEATREGMYVIMADLHYCMAETNMTLQNLNIYIYIYTHYDIYINKTLQ